MADRKDISLGLGSFWVVLIISTMEMVGILILLVINPSSQQSASRSILGYAPVYIIVGLIILKFYPGNRIGLVLAAIGMLFLMNLFTAEYENYAQLASPVDPLFIKLTEQLSNLWMLPFSLVIILLIIYPTGHLISSRWSWLAFVAALIAVSNFLFAFLAPINDQVTQFLGDIGVLLIFICLPVSVIPLIIRYRRSRSIERAQIKWFALAGCFSAIGVVSLNFIAEVVSIPQILLDVVVSVLFSCIPLSILFAILKYRLWDIDVIIRKTLVYGTLTVILSLIFFGGVTLLQSLFQVVSGQQSAVSIVVSTLAIAALFNPLRKRIQNGIDRRFYRQRYNAEQAVTRYAAMVRDETDIERLSAGLVAVVEETIRPELVSVWLMRNNPQNPAESQPKMSNSPMYNT